MKRDALHFGLDDEVLTLLLEYRGQWATVARKTGISRAWISKFTLGDIPNPGYLTLQRVYTLLHTRPELK